MGDEEERMPTEHVEHRLGDGEGRQGADVERPGEEPEVRGLWP